MKNICKLAIFSLSSTFFSQANALPGDFCPEKEALRTAVLSHLELLASHQPLTLQVQSEDGQMRSWKVVDAKFYPVLESVKNAFGVRIGNNVLPFQEDKPLMEMLRHTVTHNPISIDYDMAKVTEAEQKEFDFREQEQSWCFAQFPHPVTKTNILVFKLSQPGAQ